MSSPLRATLPATLLSVAACLTVGCGDRQELAPVRGKVTYRGKPLTSGVVMFQPLNGPPARGQIQPDGAFELELLGEGLGAPLGPNKVRISSRELSKDSGAEVGLGKLLIPKRYTDFDTSGLQVEVTADRSDPYVFDLHD